MNARTFIHFFLPRRPRRLKRRDKSRPGKEKGRWWAFGKVGPIGCLHSSDGTEEERNEVRGRGAGKRVESIRLDDREKQNEIRIWPKKKQCYGYHDRSPSRKKNPSKSLRVSGAFKHPKYAGVVNDIAFLIENDDSFRKTKLFKFFFPKKSRSDGPTSHLLKRTLPAVRPSLNYSVMQYLLNTKNKMHFDPVVVLNHFVAPGVAEPSTMGRANEQGGSLDKRIRSRIGFFVESSTGEKKCLAEAKKRLTHFIRQANDLRFAGTTKTTISLFPFFGATFFFPRDGVGVYNNRFLEDAREQLLASLLSSRGRAEAARGACMAQQPNPNPRVGTHRSRSLRLVNSWCLPYLFFYPSTAFTSKGTEFFLSGGGGHLTFTRGAGQPTKSWLTELTHQGAKGGSCTGIT
ncbi:hypothetical protein MRB53_036426 [Persea americana]|nr:hypothetical protein MRB53_036426 [Persea americana]